MTSEQRPLSEKGAREASFDTQPARAEDSASSRTVIRNLFKMLSGHLAKVLILSLSGTLVPRTLGAESYGLLAAVVAVVAMIQVLSTLGLVHTALRFIPPLWHRDRTAALQLGSTIWVVRLYAAPALGVLGAFWISSTVGSGWSPPVLLALGLLCALVLLHFKFLQDFAARTALEVARGEHFDGASQYSAYQRTLADRPDLTLYHDGSVSYRDSLQLVELGLQRLPDSFRLVLEGESDWSPSGMVQGVAE